MLLSEAGGFFKNVGGNIAHPKDKKELINEIRIRLDRGQYNLNDIDTSEITDMSFLFSGFDNYDLSKLDISKWDVSKVRDMHSMFAFCNNFNSDLSKWDVSKVRRMECMFYECHIFNSDLSKWDVSKVRDMGHTFYECHNFNSDLTKWNTGKVKNKNNIFSGCNSLQIIPNWAK